jgi:hypothetical protein
LRYFAPMGRCRRSIEIVAFSRIDNAHAAGAKLLNDVVVSERLADHEE